MSYFEDRYKDIRFPKAVDPQDEGLRRAQLGAIFAIGSHFTLRKESALVVMPTGSGKTAVLMLSAFLEQAERILVVTPSRLVRSQIAEEYKTLSTLRRIEAFVGDEVGPSVYEVESRITSDDDWNALRAYDVVVGTPSSISPGLEGIPYPPEDLFDVILIDEAHHSAARTWNDLLEGFPSAKKVLFTATPFRRDKREIKGKIVYNYPLREAHQDRVFGDIEFIAVEPAGIDFDIAIAREAERVFRADRAQGLNHFLMVRTDQKTRADQLKTIYAANTALNLQVVHSGLSYSTIKRVIANLKNKELDGIICVAMLGEGFDFPNLKIAAIHAPHKSLEVTLQFIGRFARTNAPDIGTAKFLAVPSEIEIERARLYEEGAIWQEIVANLGEGRVAEEVHIREAIEKFEPPTTLESETEDLSLYSLRPYNHVKVYQMTDDVDVEVEIEFPEPFTVIYRQVSPELSAAVYITKETHKPRWTTLDMFSGSEYDLFIFYFDKATKLLFISASRRNDLLYENLAERLTGTKPRILSLNKINKVLIDLQNMEFFQIGMRNRVRGSRTESYRTLMGSGTDRAINKSDGRLYHRGHVFGRGEENGNSITIGYSSSSKVWSNTNSKIPKLIDWCKTLAARLVSSRSVSTLSGLDYIPTSEEVTILPEGLLVADWDIEAFKNPCEIIYTTSDGNEVTCQLLDLELEVFREKSGQDFIQFAVHGDKLEYLVTYSLSADTLFSPTVDGQPDVHVVRGHHQIPLINYFNSRPINFYFADFSVVHGFNIVRFDDDEFVSYDPSYIVEVDWEACNVDPTQEIGTLNSGKICVQDYIKNDLNLSDADIVFHDHGTGEMADFITFKRAASEVLVRLYHCKGAGGDPSRERVDDAYEVCGQAVKSINWLNNQTLYDQILYRERTRHGGSYFVKGDKALLRDIINSAKALPTKYEIFVVQPGIGRAGLTEKIASLLAAANDFLLKAPCEGLRLLASA
jgi:superfamily II DNA or RNA helicase